MLRNLFLNVIGFLLLAVFIAPKQALRCHNTKDASSNETCSFNNDSVTRHCIIQLNSSSHEHSYSCDKDRLCKDRRDYAHHHVCQGAELISYYCCSHDLCNEEDHTVVVPNQNFSCAAKFACSWSYCINTTIESSKGSINVSIDCFYDQMEKPHNSTAAISLPNGDVKNTTLVDLSASCENATSTSLRPTRAAPSKSTRAPLDAKNGFSAGVVVGAILVVSAGLMLVGVGVKKCYERHLSRRLEYSYAQLTIDMLDDDDDHLILP